MKWNKTQLGTICIVQQKKTHLVKKKLRSADEGRQVRFNLIVFCSVLCHLHLCFSQYIVTFSGNFNCVFCLFVCCKS